MIAHAVAPIRSLRTTSSSPLRIGERDEDDVVRRDGDRQRGELTFALPEQTVGMHDLDHLARRRRR